MAVLVTTLGVAAGPAHAAAPANDDFATPEVLVGSNGSATGTNVDATTETGEPGHPTGPHRSVWYSWTAPFNGTADFDLCGSDFDTMMSANTGAAVDALTQITSNDDSGESGCVFQSQIEFDVASGTEYFIAVDGFGGSVGNITINWDTVAAPANDNFEDAELLVGPGGAVTGTNAGATAEPGEPEHSFSGGRSVWYRWTAPFAGTVGFHLCASDYDTVAAAYTGSAVDALTEVASNDDACGFGSRLDFPVLTGTEYHIAVDGFGGETGNIGLKWSAVPKLPDAKIKRPSDAAFTGDDVYRHRSFDDFFEFEDPNDQAIFTKVKRGKTGTFTIQFENDGGVPDTYTVEGCWSSKGFKVKYLDGDTDVTDEVTDGVYTTPSLAPGETTDLTLKIKVSKKAKGTKHCSVTASSDESFPVVEDVLWASVKAKR